MGIRPAHPTGIRPSGGTDIEQHQPDFLGSPVHLKEGILDELKRN